MEKGTVKIHKIKRIKTNITNRARLMDQYSVWNVRITTLTKTILILFLTKTKQAMTAIFSLLTQEPIVIATSLKTSTLLPALISNAQFTVHLTVFSLLMKLIRLILVRSSSTSQAVSTLPWFCRDHQTFRTFALNRNLAVMWLTKESQKLHL